MKRMGEFMTRTTAERKARMFPFGSNVKASTLTKRNPFPTNRSEQPSGCGTRRVSRLSLSFSTRGNIGSIEKWLRHHCVGEWNIVIEGMSSDLRGKELRVSFDRDEDRQRFKTAFFAPSRSR